MARLQDKVAVVTGGGSGIGRATALKFAQEHAAVVVVDKDPEGAEHTAELLGEIGAASAWFESDVSDNNQARLVAEQIRKQFGGIDVLVTAAAISVGKTIPDTSPDEWDAVFDVNVKGTYLWIRAAIPLMEQNGGSIIALASQLAISGGVSNAAYIAS